MRHPAGGIATRSTADPRKRLPQSGMGVASIVLAIISLMVVGLEVAIILTTTATFGSGDIDGTPFAVFLGCLHFAVVVIGLCGIVFGIGGMRQANRRHSLATIGLCINIAVPLGMMFLLLLAVTHRQLDDENHAIHPRVSALDDSGSSTVAAIATFAAVVIAGVLVVRIWNKRHSRAQRPAAAANSSICRRCGKNLTPASRFCRRCGMNLATV